MENKPNEIAAPLASQQVAYLALIQGDKRSFRTPFALRVTGELNVCWLRGSFDEVVRRHGALRTRITSEAGVRQQVVDPGVKCHFEIVDFRNRDTSSAVAEAERQIVELAQEHCDLAVGPLLKVVLFVLGENDHILVTAFHHIIIDSFSKKVMFKELWALYREYSRGAPSPFRRDPPQYVDYARMQCETYLSWLEKHAGFWQHRLKGAEIIAWPNISTSRRAEFGPACSVDLRFDADISADLRRAAVQAKTRLSMIMLAVWATVVAQWCRVRDFIIPMNIAGQHLSEHGSTIGYFTQFLYLRVSVLGEESFEQLIQRLTDEFNLALLHQDYDRIAVSAPEFLWGGVFTWDFWTYEERAGKPPPELSKDLDFKADGFPVDLSASDAGSLNTPFDTSIWLNDGEAGIRGTINYRSDVLGQLSSWALVKDLQSAAARLVNTLVRS